MDAPSRGPDRAVLMAQNQLHSFPADNNVTSNQGIISREINNVSSRPDLDRIYSTDTEDSSSSNETNNTSSEMSFSGLANTESRNNTLYRNIDATGNSNSPQTPPQLLPIRCWFRASWYTSHTFEEAVMTLKPTSAACLLAILAICNLGSLFFHSYTALWWLSKGNFAKNFISCRGDTMCWLSTITIFGPDGVIQNQSVTSHIVAAWLLAQIVVNALKLCFRFNTKRLCIRFIRSPVGRLHSNENHDEIGNIMHSMSFRVHVGLGRTAQILAVMGYLFYFSIDRDEFKESSEIVSHVSNEFTSTKILLDVCCANVVVAFFRAFVALYVLHYYAFQDQIQRLNPPTVSPGLSHVELYHLMKKNTFRKSIWKKKNDDFAEKIKNAQCAICLQPFDEDHITVLPCDGQHLFHSACIKTWLVKRDSCPLCQYSLRHLTPH